MSAGSLGLKLLTRIGAALALLTLAACATVNSARAPGADLSRLKTFYVVRMPDDERGVEKLIANRLTTLGYPSTSGDTQTPPSKVDGIVTYNDRWMWDITMYMIRLDIEVRDGATGAILANGQVMRPSLQRKSPEGMVEETLGVVFK
jgi:hypothetical protein